MVCHRKEEFLRDACEPPAMLAGSLVNKNVPDGMPCWHPSDPRNVRRGMCFGGHCVLPHKVAAVPVCGNGGIDPGEECDCGDLFVWGGNSSFANDNFISSCCECATCVLKKGAKCAPRVLGAPTPKGGGPPSGVFSCPVLWQYPAKEMIQHHNFGFRAARRFAQRVKRFFALFSEVFVEGVAVAT